MANVNNSNKEIKIEQIPFIEIGDKIKIHNVIMNGKVTSLYSNDNLLLIFVTWYSIFNSPIESVIYEINDLEFNYISNCWYVKDKIN